MNTTLRPLSRAVVHMRDELPQIITRSVLIDEGCQCESDEEFIMAIKRRLEVYHDVRAMSMPGEGELHILVTFNARAQASLVTTGGQDSQQTSASPEPLTLFPAMKISKATLIPFATEFPNNLQKVYLRRPGVTDEDFLTQLKFSLWKKGIECLCVCEGEVVGEIVILADYFPDGECG